MSPQAKVDSLCVFAPIRDGLEDALRTKLERLPDGGDSPLAKLGTHVARFVIVPYLDDCDERPLEGRSYLLFGSEFDGSADRYLHALARMPEATEIWSHCAGYRDDRDPDTLRRYLQEYRVRPGYSIVAYPTASLDEVLESLRLRDRLTAFAVRTSGLDPAALQREWRAEFPAGA